MAMKSVIVGTLLWLEILVLGTFSCPDFCECKWEHDLHTVDCTEKNITQVPVNADNTVQIIILDRNNLAGLKAFEFYDANWAQVRKIRLQFCNLKSLMINVFSGLTKLRHLDLSHNQISVIPNNYFPPLPDLESLNLSDNILVNIHSDGFSRIGSNLSRIDLSGNNLIKISWKSFRYLPKLRLVNLERNSWECDCSLEKLNTELKRRNTRLISIMSKPIKL